MNRLDFIRLSAGASVVTLFGTLSELGGTSVDSLERWASRHKAEVKTRKGVRRLVAKPSRSDLGSALRELDKIADGPLWCRGNLVRGTHSGQPFMVRLTAVS